VDAGRLVVSDRKQDFDQARPLGILVIGPVAEDLLELVDQQQEVLVLLEPDLLGDRGEPVFARVDQDPGLATSAAGNSPSGATRSGRSERSIVAVNRCETPRCGFMPLLGAARAAPL
jgi:hypothetical protein